MKLVTIGRLILAQRQLAEVVGRAEKYFRELPLSSVSAFLSPPGDQSVGKSLLLLDIFCAEDKAADFLIIEKSHIFFDHQFRRITQCNIFKIKKRKICQCTNIEKEIKK